jgi:acyl-CoA reductase-like NAD-dependent aldehyde dehydrogenase
VWRLTTLLIGGEAVTGAGAPLAVENPYTTSTIVEASAALPEQVAAVAAAREAWPGWARATASGRRELLHEVARRLREGSEILARTMKDPLGRGRTASTARGRRVARLSGYAEQTRLRRFGSRYGPVKVPA